MHLIRPQMAFEKDFTPSLNVFAGKHEESGEKRNGLGIMLGSFGYVG